MFIIPGWVFWEQKADSAIAPAMVWTAVVSCAVDAGIKPESERWRKNAGVDSFGVVMLSAMSADIEKKNTFATNFNCFQMHCQVFFNNKIINLFTNLNLVTSMRPS